MDGSLDDLPKSAEERLELRVEQAMEQYLDQLESGTPLDRVEFLRQHADIADELSQQIEAIEFLHLATPEVLGAGDDEELSHPPVADATALGDFQLIRPIGRGGMGIVYEAIQISLDRRVAVKVLPFASMLDAKQRKRFKNEARAAATLDHPNIVPIYFIGQERGVHFYAMQLIEGQSLTEVIRGLSDTEQKPADSTTITTTFSTQRVRSRDKYYRSIAELGAQIAQALQHAHEQG
ncbi:MAG: protein kinase, partial [Planctomycetales bacterium]|nr:protein kinase [Planctomycetales bacterium]